MNIFFISFHNYDYDGRTKELVKVANKLGNVYGIIPSKKNRKQLGNIILCDDKISYFVYILKVVLYFYRCSDCEILFVDNRKAALPALLIKLFNKHIKIIYDMRELYIFNEIESFFSKVGCILEKLIIKKADIVICANEYRAKYVRDNYEISHVIFFENIWKLEYSDNVNLGLLENKFKRIKDSDKFTIISTSGMSVSRGDGKLLTDLLPLKDKVNILLVGNASSFKEEQIIRQIINNNNLSNIYIMGQLNHDELKYLISVSDCGVVNYNLEDTNNRYCASGKIFEFIFEGKPVITTMNPPLVEMCHDLKIGVSSDDYYSSVVEVMDKYEFFSKNVLEFKKSISIDTNNNCLYNYLKEYFDN